MAQIFTEGVERFFAIFLFHENLPLQKFSKHLNFLEEFISGQINLFQSTVVFHIETSHLICTANQVTSFSIKCSTGLKWVEFVVFICKTKLYNKMQYKII